MNEIPSDAMEGKELSWVLYEAWLNWFHLAHPGESVQENYGRLEPIRWIDSVCRLTDHHLLAVLEALRDGRPVARMALADHPAIYSLLVKRKALVANGSLVWLAAAAPNWIKTFVRVTAANLLERVDPLRNNPKIQAVRKQFEEEGKNAAADTGRG